MGTNTHTHTNTNAGPKSISNLNGMTLLKAYTVPRQTAEERDKALASVINGSPESGSANGGSEDKERLLVVDPTMAALRALSRLAMASSSSGVGTGASSGLRTRTKSIGPSTSGSGQGQGSSRIGASGASGGASAGTGSGAGAGGVDLVERRMTAVPPRPKTPSRAKTPLRLGSTTPGRNSMAAGGRDGGGHGRR